MTLRRTIVLLALCAVAVAGYWGWQSWQLQQPGFHARDCWFGKTVTGAARCGFLVVRENRQMPESRTIRLPVVIFEAEKQADRKEPILYLTGGPGGSAYLGNQRQIDSWWAERRFLPPGHDFIVMAQRGTGLQELDIDCPELRGIEIALEARPQGEAPPDSRKLSIAAAQACAQRLVEEGVDLTAYNSRESAADIAELRRTLGIEEWTLYGVSYGTRLALSTLRYHPEGIRAVILDSVFPPEASWALGAASDFRQALEKDFTDCAEDPGCTQQYGDLSEVYPPRGRAVERGRAFLSPYGNLRAARAGVQCRRPDVELRTCRNFGSGRHCCHL